jgi:hypothetical protein
MRVYIGVDFHARQQTVSYLTTEDGEIHQCKLDCAPFLRPRVKLQFLTERSNCDANSKEVHKRI